MTNTEQILTVVIIMAATMLTRFISFLLFPADKETPAFVQYLTERMEEATWVSSKAVPTLNAEKSTRR